MYWCDFISDNYRALRVINNTRGSGILSRFSLGTVWNRRARSIDLNPESMCPYALVFFFFFFQRYVWSRCYAQSLRDQLLFWLSHLDFAHEICKKKDLFSSVAQIALFGILRDKIRVETYPFIYKLSRCGKRDSDYHLQNRAISKSSPNIARGSGNDRESRTSTNSSACLTIVMDLRFTIHNSASTLPAQVGSITETWY